MHVALRLPQASVHVKARARIAGGARGRGVACGAERAPIRRRCQRIDRHVAPSSRRVHVTQPRPSPGGRGDWAQGGIMERFTSITGIEGMPVRLRFRRRRVHPAPGIDDPDRSPLATDANTLRQVGDGLGRLLPQDSSVIADIDVGDLGIAGALPYGNGRASPAASPAIRGCAPPVPSRCRASSASSPRRRVRARRRWARRSPRS